ncbi:TonB-dependent receptor [Psychroflexus sp. MBR-150]
MKKYFILSLFLSISTILQAQNLKQVSGTVKDGEGNPLPYATVVFTGNQGVITDQNGAFDISLQAGNYTLKVIYIGYQTYTEEVVIQQEDQKTTINVVLQEDVSTLEGVVVYGRLTRGQAKALNTQKNLPNISNVVSSELFLQYPDVSAAETVQRIPGISITRDQGEGEFVQIRGTSEQYNAVTINGQRLPSAEPDAGRAVGLDMIQSYLIETITVTKALRPDMDADALGGMVDFQLRKAGDSLQGQFYAGYGYNDQESVIRKFGRDIGSFSGFVSQRFFDKKLGVLVAGSYYNTDRGSLFDSWRYLDKEANTLSRRRATDYDINRERYGFVANFDYVINPNNSLELSANYNRYLDNEIRRLAIFTQSNNREERRTRNRLEDQETIFFQLVGRHKFSGFELDYAGSYGVAKENLPNRTEWRFRRPNSLFWSDLTREEQENIRPNIGFDLPDMEFSSVRFTPRNTEEKAYTGSFNLKIPFIENKSSFKVGTKIRYLDRTFREASLNISETDLTPPEVLLLPSGQFAFEDVHLNDQTAIDLNLDGSTADVDFINDEASYDAEETVIATYLMNTTQWSDKFSTIAGFRLENTNVDYIQTATQNSGSGSYNTWLPSVHGVYKFDDKSQLRVAYSSGLSRPEYSLLVPVDIIDDGQQEINRGNPDLEAITTQNFDVMFERYSNNLGFFSVGFFAKFLENPIITGSFNETIDGTPYVVFRPENGGSAKLFGAEFAFNQSLAPLGVSFLKDVSINGNYTFVDSQADFDDERDDLPLVHSPKHTGNFSFVYDNPKNGLNLVLAGAYRHFMFDKFEGDDVIWLDSTFHLDASIGYQLTKNLNAKLKINNITNQTNSEVNGKPSKSTSRVHEREKYGYWFTLGVDYKF